MLNIQKNIPLAPYTTLKIGGPADYFVEAHNEDEIIEALIWAQTQKIPYYVLSGGSNVLISDQGFRGLILRITNYELRITNASVIAGAGVPLPLIAKKTAEQGLSGLEFCIGVPGTVGGAVYGNAGAFGQETKDVLESARVVMPKKDCTSFFSNHKQIPNSEFQIPNHGDKNQWVTTELPKNACQFAYRESIFKSHKNWIIVEVSFLLKTDAPANCKKRMLAMLKDKTTNQPMGERAAGSIFKNPPNAKAWELISEAEMKGYQIGGAKVSDIHANYIINTGNATAEQMVMLIAMIKQRVRVRAKVQLQEEIQYVGF